MFIVKLIGKILLIPLWIIVAVLTVVVSVTVTVLGFAIVNKENVEKFEEPSDYRKIKSEEVKAFEETISSMIRDLVFEASDIACWVFAKKYVNGWTLEQMIEDMPHAFKFIVAVNTLFEQHMEPASEKEFKN